MTNSCTVPLQDLTEPAITRSSGNWYEDFSRVEPLVAGLLRLVAWRSKVPWGKISSSVTRPVDPWLPDERQDIVTVLPRRRLLVDDLGWSTQEAQETYHRLRAFREDWDAPEMVAYDDL